MIYLKIDYFIFIVLQNNYFQYLKIEIKEEKNMILYVWLDEKIKNPWK